MKKLLLISLLLSTVLFAGSLSGSLKVGEAFPNVTLKDQFDKPLSVNKNDRWVLMAFEKSVAIGVADYFKTKPKGYLKKAHIKYISDISTMPSFITSMFALPKMKTYPFSVMLIRDDSGKMYRIKEGKATLYRVKNGTIKAIEFVTVEALGNTIGE